MDVSDLRHRAGKFLGVLRTGLGRMVVLGSGRERFVHALAGRNGVDSFARSDRETRRIQELDRAVSDRRVFSESAGNVPGSFRSSYFSARFRKRSQARNIHSGISNGGDRRLVNPVRVARKTGWPRFQVRDLLARITIANKQRSAGRRCRVSLARHFVSAVRRRAESWQAFSRPALFQQRVRTTDGPGGVLDWRGTDRPLETRQAPGT